MKLSIEHILSVLSLLLLQNLLPRADAFCSVATCGGASISEMTIAFETSSSSSPTTILMSSKDDAVENENDKDDKFKNMAMNEVRKARLEKESSNSERFASGEELTSLREDLESLRQNLEWAKALKDDIRVESLEKAIKKGESRDPTFMYSKAQKMIAETKKMKDASEEEKKIVIDKWNDVAHDAREFLPQLNMEGLWVGK